MPLVVDMDRPLAGLLPFITPVLLLPGDCSTVKSERRPDACCRHPPDHRKKHNHHMLLDTTYTLQACSETPVAQSLGLPSDRECTPAVCRSCSLRTGADVKPSILNTPLYSKLYESSTSTIQHWCNKPTQTSKEQGYLEPADILQLRTVHGNSGRVGASALKPVMTGSS